MAYVEYTAQFPGSLATAADLYEPDNDGTSTTLLQNITGVSPGEAGKLYLTSNSNFGADGGVVNVVSTGERISYSGVGTDGTGDYLTVVYRALPGGAGASSATAGDTVRDIISAEHFKRLSRELIAAQTAIGTTGAVFVNSGNSFAASAVLGTNDNNTLAFETNATIAMTIDTSQNVGIGTAAPAYNLHVVGTTFIGKFEGTANPLVDVIDTTNNATARLQALDTFGLVGSSTTHDFRIYTDGAARMSFDTTGGVYIGDTANANMTVGLTINQGANDNEILALKSSDVGHGRISLAETDTFFSVSKINATQGGFWLKCLANDDTLQFPCYITVDGGTAGTAKTTSANGMVTFLVSEHDGANNVANITADGNVFCVQARVGGANVARFLVDEDGDMYSVTAGQTFDDYDDMALVESYDAIRSDYNDFAIENEQKLIDVGVLGARVKDGGLTNVTQLQRLHNGALRQLSAKLQDTLERLALAENKLQLLEAK